MVVFTAHLCDYKEHFKWVNFIACELYLNKVVKKMTFHIAFIKTSKVISGLKFGASNLIHLRVSMSHIYLNRFVSV